ncbi:D-ribitol-5-phosphate cytidylyltransferase-like isoform X2 [Clytia hemisphaerica]
MEFTQEIIDINKYDKVKLVIGKDTRHRSINVGVNSIESSADDIVIVHDAVRPFLKEDFLKQLVEQAIINKAAGAVRALVSTVVKCDVDGFMESSLVRSQYRESHTPQAFQFEVLENAYKQCSQEDFNHGTECLDLVQKYCGVRPKLVDGPEYLWKVTHQKDIILMESFLQREKEHR